MNHQLIELVGATVGLCWALGITLFALIVSLAALSRTLRTTCTPRPVLLLAPRMGSAIALIANLSSLILWLSILAALPDHVQHRRSAQLLQACKLQAALQLLLVVHWMLSLVRPCQPSPPRSDCTMPHDTGIGAPAWHVQRRGACCGVVRGACAVVCLRRRAGRAAPTQETCAAECWLGMAPCRHHSVRTKKKNFD